MSREIVTVVSLNPEKITDTQLARDGCVTVNFASWQRMKPYLAAAAGVPEDRVIGVRVIEQCGGPDGIEIILS